MGMESDPMSASSIHVYKLSRKAAATLGLKLILDSLRRREVDLFFDVMNVSWDDKSETGG